MSLVFKLCDLTGASVAEVTDPGPGSGAAVELNGQRTAKLLLPFDSPSYPQGLRPASEAYPHMRVVKVLLDGEPLVSAHIVKPVFNLAERRVEISAVDPSDRLVHSQVNNRGDTNFGTGTGVLPAMTNDPDYAGIYPNISPQDQGQIIKRLIDHAAPTSTETAAGVPGHGISTTLGILPASVTRSRVYDTGKGIWEAIVQLSEVEGGPDFSLTALDRTDGILCKLDVYPDGQGTDRSGDVAFEYGLGLDNCANVIWTPDGAELRNRWMVMGESIEDAAPNFYRANQAGSQQAFGIRSGFESRSDVSESFTMQSIARAKVARDAFPPDYIEVTPVLDDGTGRYRDPDTHEVRRREAVYGKPVRIGPNSGKHDCWIGDVVRVVAVDRPTVELGTDPDSPVRGRLWRAEWTVDADGAVICEGKLTPTISFGGVA